MCQDTKVKGGFFWMKINLAVGDRVFREKDKPVRRVRSDKRVRSTLRIDNEMDKKIKAVAFNHSTSKQKVIDEIIKMVLMDDVLFSKMIKRMPQEQMNPYLIIR